MRTAHGSDGMHTEVRSWPVTGGVQRFELVVHVGKTGTWAPELARVLSNMGWRTWGFDPLELAGVLRMPPEEAMERWGSRFWATYAPDADVLLAVGAQRDTVMRGLRTWTTVHQTLTYGPELDFDGQERQRLAKRRERASAIKSWFRLPARHSGSQ